MEIKKRQAEMRICMCWFRNETVAAFEGLRRYFQWGVGPARLLANRKTRIYLIGAIVLLVGLGAALLLYLTCAEVPDSDLVYQIHHAKRYRRDLEVMGGQMNLLADDLSLWFEGLWQGRSLAYTVAAMTVIVSFGFFLVAYHLPADPSSDA